ncbi:MAG: DUF302 domain-containing protein [Tepidimonas sp.]
MKTIRQIGASWRRAAAVLAMVVGTVITTGCGTVATIGKLEDGAGAEAMKMWDRWIDGDGDIAVATTWERKVKPGLSVADVEEIMRNVMVERNMRDVGTLPLSKELEARSGKKEPTLIIYQICSPSIARHMVDFSSHMAAYMPCRIALVERANGLWLYTLNMDMMVKMGRKLPSPLKEEAWSVREAIWDMLERAAKGEI